MAQLQRSGLELGMPRQSTDFHKGLVQQENSVNPTQHPTKILKTFLVNLDLERAHEHADLNGKSVS